MKVGGAAAAVALGVVGLLALAVTAGDDGGDVKKKTSGEKLSPNFARTELDPYLEAGGSALSNLQTLATSVLEAIRSATGVAVVVTGQGGYNGPTVDAIRKAKGQGLRELTSQHRLGKAADLRTPAGWTYDQWADKICELAAAGKLPPNVGIGIYTAADNFVHVDLGGRRGFKTRKGCKHF